MKKIAAVGLGSLALLLTPQIAAAGTQTISTPTVSPNPTAGSPVTLTETGTSDPSSTLTVSVQAGGGACAATTTPIDSAVVSGSFTHTSTFTPTAPGPYTICFAFAGPNGSQSESFTIDVAPAPPPPSPAPAPAPATAHCVTPQLLRHTPAYAQHLLTKADCKLGRVYQPSQRTLSQARRVDGGHAPKLIVVSQTPREGAVSYADAVVAIRLGLAPPPRPAARRRGATG
jgi:hypothetical protein